MKKRIRAFTLEVLFGGVALLVVTAILGILSVFPWLALAMIAGVAVAEFRNAVRR